MSDDFFAVGPSDEDVIELRPREKQEAELDMTPMVDVTFLLLIFFMVTASLELQKSFRAPPDEDGSSEPVAAEALDRDQEVTVIRIDPYNTFFIPAADGQIAEIVSQQDLIVSLRGLRASLRPPPPRAVVIAHGDALHERVIMALDAAAEVGYDDISWTVTEEDGAM